MKYSLNFKWRVKKYLFLLFFLIPICVLNAQPLNGNYTVGGSSPDFLTLQNAADALNARGVSGPVFMNIRPGIYMRDGGVSSVMILDSAVAGLSADNRITFQPDQNAGGNVENVILRIDLTSSSSTALVLVRIDHVTIRNITLEDNDSTGFGADFLLRIDAFFSYNPITEDIIIEGCRFIGNSNSGGGATRGTDSGVNGSTNTAEIIIRQNIFLQLMNSVEIGGAGGSSGGVIIEDNQFLDAHHHGSSYGNWINIKAHKTIVRRNYLDNANGYGSLNGIIVYADSGLIESNIIKNGGGSSGQVVTFRAIKVDNLSSNPLSMLIVNNMISGSASVGGWGLPVIGRYGIIANTKATIIHNTIVHPYRVQISYGIYLGQGSDSSKVLNNIVFDYGSGEGLPIVEAVVVFKQNGNISGVISDYNVFYYDYNQPGSVYLAAVGSNRYTSLSSYQAATGLDSNSIFKELYFDIGEEYPHLSDCQAQDPEIVGIPYPGIVDDVDGDLRSLTKPTRGADEGNLRSNPMFEDVFRTSLPSICNSIAYGKFDNLMADGLAIADYENEQVLLFHNLPESRSFLQSGILNVGFKPTTLAFCNFDDDGYLDLIVGGDSALVKVYWGDGVGGFPESSEIITQGRTYHLVPEPYQLYDSLKVIFVAHPNASPYYSSFIGVVMNLGDRQLCYDYQHYGNEIDTIPWGPWSIVVDDIGGDNLVDIAGLHPTGRFTSWEFFNIFTVFPSACDHYYFERWNPFHQIDGVGGNYLYQNSVILGDFDDDSDNDLITTGFSDNECNLLRNEGNFNFQPEPMAVENGRGFARLDYDNDDDLDFASVNWALENHGLTVFLNDGTGNFTPELNCFQSIATGIPRGVVSSDFDLDGKTDLAIIATDNSGNDSLFVLYSTGNISAIGEETFQQIPENFSLSQNYPNPFNPSTTIRFELPEEANVTLKIFNIIGEEVSTLVDTELKAGQHEYQFNANNLASGIYFYSISTGSFYQTKKMVLVR
ncbi:MAG: T9SS type A sorting domain-containing protein [Ignavibacterium sp.]|jgi:hypothetical protein|nr:T9SS type A sorting domain-containing protein [Ignavibacterium sp.]